MLLKPIAAHDHKIMAALNSSFYSYVKKGVRDNRRLQTVRASALPFCVRSFVERASKPSSDLDAFGAFFTSVGTTVHDWVQDLAGRSGLILGDWYNVKTKKWRRFSLHPDPSDHNWQYKELEAKVLGAVGHCDGVFCLNAKLAKKANKKKNEKARLQAFADLQVPLFVIDYKTCTLASVPSKVKESGSSYTLQLLFYCLYFHKLGLNVKGYGNFYIPRDNPAKWNMNSQPWGPKDRKYITKRLKGWVTLHKRALVAETWSDFKALYKEGACDSQYCSVCRARDPKAVFKKAFKEGMWPIEKAF